MAKLLVFFVAVVALVAGAGLAYLYARYPAVPPPEDVRIQATPERLARGEYLVENVAGCVVCHAEREWTQYSAPVIASTKGQGGQRFGFGAEPFVLYAKNITPAGLADWTDGELLRAITMGVSRDGTPLFPLMPYLRYGRMARDDVEAIVAYLRTMPAVPAQPVPARTLAFPLPLIVRTMPTTPSHRPVPAAADRVAYGEYLVNAAVCADCHTPMDDQGAPIPGMTFAGGTPFSPNGVGLVRSANITADAGTGIGTWTEDQFVGKFQAYRDVPPRTLSGPERLQNTEMPWTYYAGMRDDDLRAIYAYLRSAPPVVHRVEKFGNAGAQ
jgi:mono/diheme cytochrome c family protein